MTDLIADPGRSELHGSTGIFIRAFGDGGWGTYDIAELDGPSLLQFLRSRGDSSPWAESVVFAILWGSTQLPEQELADREVGR